MENIFLARSKHNIVGHLKQFDLCKCWVPAICDVRNCIYLGKKKMKNVSFKNVNYLVNTLPLTMTYGPFFIH